MFRKSPILLLLMMFLFSLSACSTVEGTAEASAIIETTVMPTEQTATPTELSIPMEETVPIPVVKTEFVLETIDGQDYYAMNGYRYSAKLGAPELGLEAMISAITAMVSTIMRLTQSISRLDAFLRSMGL